MTAPLPRSLHTTDDLAYWNEAHRTDREFAPYHSHRMVQSRIGFDPTGWTPQRLAAALHECAGLILDPEACDDPSTMADIHAFLDNAQRLLPTVPAWVVTKHYAHETDTSWKPAIWCGFHEEADARLCAPLLEEHYARGHRNPDRFVVSRGRCRILDFMRPGTDVRAYVDGLGK